MTATLAPELPPTLEWVNSDPVRLAELRGRAVVLWFWHAGSIWCEEVLDDLRALHQRHGSAVALVGVHVPKFDADRSSRRVLKAANRLGVPFAVASDADFVAWRHFGIAGWPTLLVLDAHGAVRRVLTGAGRGAELEQAVAAVLREGAGQPAPVAEPFRPLQHPEPRQALAFPSGLAWTPTHLYVADSGHNRILECTHDGDVLRQFGSGTAGLLDGDAEAAAFHSPRGLCVVKDSLYIADTGNHALRRVRLAHGEVETIGARGQSAGEPAWQSPFDVAPAGDALVVAMAGAQQVCLVNPSTGAMRVLAGSGELGLGDGDGEIARFAQPVALAAAPRCTYVADSATSAVRQLLHGDPARVQTLLGQDLFEFGERDGTRSTARLQAPGGLALDPEVPLLWIADTGNDALRLLRLEAGDLRAVELDYRLYAPTALAAGGGAVWVANSGAHEILRVAPGSGVVRRLPVGE